MTLPVYISMKPASGLKNKQGETYQDFNLTCEIKIQLGKAEFFKYNMVLIMQDQGHTVVFWGFWNLKQHPQYGNRSNLTEQQTGIQQIHIAHSGQ